MDQLNNSLFGIFLYSHRLCARNGIDFVQRNSVLSFCHSCLVIHVSQVNPRVLSALR